MNLLQDFSAYINREKLFSRGDRLLVGVSGGLDSTVLCNLLKEGGYSFGIAHANFQLRGEESIRDENFCQALAVSLDVPFFVNRFETESYAADKGLSIQLAARELRYDWMESIMEESKAGVDAFDCLLTAHHANDNAETVMMNVFRGTGLAGMHGILPSRGRIRRPLLFAERTVIEAYARDRKLNWVEDSSNASVKYTRNFIRHAVVPLVKQQYPSVISNLNDTAGYFRQVQSFYEHSMRALLKKLIVHNGPDQQISILKWRQLPGPEAILHAWLYPYGFSAGQIGEVASLADSQTGQFIESSTHRLINNRKWFVLTEKQETASLIPLVEGNGNIRFRDGMLEWNSVHYSGQLIPADPNIAWLDSSLIGYPLLLRPWKQGDYFYPLGMQKKKKLARYFIDAKLSRAEKERIWVLESDKKIVWVIGHRIDNRVKIRPGTTEVLALRFNNVI